MGGVEDVVIWLDFIFHSILEVLLNSHNVDGAIILCQHRQKSEVLHVSSSIEQKEKKEDRIDVLYVYSTPKVDISGWISSHSNKQEIKKKVYNIFLVLQFSPSRYLHV